MHCSRLLLMGGCAIGALTLLSACRSDPDLTPSPIPPAYAALMQSGQINPAARKPRGRRKGERVLDGVIASVGDKFLTRREVERRLRLAPEQDGPMKRTREQEIDAERVRWATEQLFVKSARQIQITVPSDRLDEYAEERLTKMRKRASEELGRELSRDEYLRERRMTWTEFTNQMRDYLTASLYMAKLLQGISGTRAIVDTNVSPAERRQLYNENREMFNIKPGAKIALFQLLTDGVADEDHTPAECEALVQRRAEQLASLFRQGYKPKALAAHYQLNDEDFGFFVQPPMQPIENIAKSLKDDNFAAWIRDPARRVGDAYVYNDRPGPAVIGIVETQTAKVLTFAEADEKIVGHIQQGMENHLRAKLVIDMIAQGSVVSPPDLEDLLLDAAHQTMDQIATDPLLKRARLR